jgi:hypothetical protein
LAELREAARLVEEVETGTVALVLEAAIVAWS